MEALEGRWTLGLAGSTVCVYEWQSDTGVWPGRLFKAPLILYLVGTEEGPGKMPRKIVTAILPVGKLDQRG